MSGDRIGMNGAGNAGAENGMDGNSVDETMVHDILKHLDSEIEMGAARMSVIIDEQSDEKKTISHKCCVSYGRPATETVGLLDMYTDLSAGKPDRNNEY